MISRRALLFSLPPMTALLAACAQSKGTRRAPPEDVLIIRHAEEPEDGPHLNKRGEERANALSKLFAGRFPKPTALVAARPSHSSSRSVETLTPLSRVLGLPIDQRYSTFEFRALATDVLSGHYQGGHLLICWHREAMSDLAAALGVKDPPVVKSKQYDRIWRLRFTSDGAECRNEGQHLLPGDDPETSKTDGGS